MIYAGKKRLAFRKNQYFLTGYKPVGLEIEKMRNRQDAYPA